MILDHDGQSDLFIRNGGQSGEIYLGWMYGPSSPTWNYVSSVPWDGCSWQAQAAADTNFDGDNDILWSGSGCSGMSIWYMDGNANFLGYVDSWSGLPSLDSSNWSLVGTGDFNLDSQPDLVLQDVPDGQMQIWYGDANCTGRTCTPTYSYAATLYFQPDELDAIGVADVDGDGAADILMRVGSESSWHRRIRLGGNWGNYDFPESYGSFPVPRALGNYTGLAGDQYLYNGDMVWSPPLDTSGRGAWNFSFYTYGPPIAYSEEGIRSTAGEAISRRGHTSAPPSRCDQSPAAIALAARAGGALGFFPWAPPKPRIRSREFASAPPTHSAQVYFDGGALGVFPDPVRHSTIAGAHSGPGRLWLGQCSGESAARQRDIARLAGSGDGRIARRDGCCCRPIKQRRRRGHLLGPDEYRRR